MATGAAKMAIGRGISVWVLDAPTGFGAADYHSHHAIQITVALEGRLSLSTRSESRSSPALAVSADALHRIDGRGVFAFLFVEPESRHGRSLSKALFAKGELVELADGVTREISFDVPVKKSCWVALRIRASSHTNPIFVIVNEKPIREKRSLEWCLKSVDQCWSQKEALIAPKEHADAVAEDHEGRDGLDLQGCLVTNELAHFLVHPAFYSATAKYGTHQRNQDHQQRRHGKDGVVA